MSVDLLVAPCSHEAAKYAVMHWHYSKRMPVGKIIRFGIWEDSEYIGAVLFARGNSPTLGASYGLKMTECCELVRVALTSHKSAVSQIVAKCLKALKATNPGMRLVISFADPAEGHNGSIYQAMNWIYNGQSAPDKAYFFQGRWKHSREIRGGAFGSSRKLSDYSGLPIRIVNGKYRYLYPLDKAMRRQIEPLAQPYPKRADVGEIESRDGSTVETLVQFQPSAPLTLTPELVTD